MEGIELLYVRFIKPTLPTLSEVVMSDSSQEAPNTNEPRSYFARRLAEDPELAAKAEEIASIIREAAAKDIEAGRRMERIGPDDLGIIINARADDRF
jgi:hypothetical protein